ncbi:MAG: hypothetical protein FWD73_07300 [Polyangiaceae bacterium]|nr:hypothetical protein [Polyangiaceae bacterium]
MGHFGSIALSFPCGVYTVLLGAALIYWVFVMIGLARLELHADGGAGLDGLDGGAHAGDVGGHHAGDIGDAGGHHAGDGDAGDGGDHDAGADGHDGPNAHAPPSGVLSGMLASLKLRSVPATVTASVIVLFAWLFSTLAMLSADTLVPSARLGTVRIAVFFLAPLVALPFTSLAIRPLAPLFAPPKAAGRQDLVGQICTIRTGTVTERFGEAMLDDGGAGLVVRVRVDGDDKLGRGDKAVIVGYDDDTQEFTVARLDDDFIDDRPRRSGSSANR